MSVIIDPPRYHLQVGKQKFQFLPTVKISEATASLRDYASEIKNTPVVVTSGGRPVALLIPIPGIAAEEFERSTEPGFLDVIERARRRLLEQTRQEFSQDSGPTHRKAG